MLLAVNVTPSIAGLSTLYSPAIYDNSINPVFSNRRFFSIAEAVERATSQGVEWEYGGTYVTKTQTDKDVLISLGFPSVICSEDIALGRYELDNGSSIVINSRTTDGRLSVTYVDPDGNDVGDYTLPTSSRSVFTLFPSFIPGELISGSDPLYFFATLTSVGTNSFYWPFSNNVFNAEIFAPFWEGLEPKTDPYAGGGTTGTGGGTGDFDGSSDVIDFPPLPTLSATDTGFIELFNPSALQLKALANYMWGDLFDLDTWKKIFADPMDAILGLSIVPVDVPAGGAGAVIVGNISTGVSMTRAAAQYVEVDCGTLNVNEFWGAYLDYDPYTKAEIYLPYVGTHPLAVDDIMGKAVHVKYHVDILSGACCAYVRCGTAVLYSWTGQCSCSVPITGNDWTNVVNGAISIAASIGSMVATGGASAPMAMSSIASTAVNSMKPSVEKSGAMGSMGGMLGIQKPYLILTRPRQAAPENQNSFTGYPSFITMKLGDCAGYTEVEYIHIENIPATDTELSEIETLLKGGVIF